MQVLWPMPAWVWRGVDFFFNTFFLHFFQLLSWTGGIAWRMGPRPTPADMLTGEWGRIHKANGAQT